MKTPRDYQITAIENYQKFLASEEQVATIVLSMGLGKTYTMSRCIALNPKLTYLWVAHQEELINQALTTLHEELGPEFVISSEIANRKGRAEANVLVSSVQTLVRDRVHLRGWKPDVIFIDEYHHFADHNVQYRSIRKRWPQAKIVGATATLWRNDEVALPMGTMLVHMDLFEAIQQQYLVPPEFEVMSALSTSSLRGLSFNKLLNPQSIVDDKMCRRVVELVQAGRQGIMFASSTEHARELYYTLASQVRAGQIYWDTPKAARQDIMQRLRNKELDVLVNFNIGTEGLNIPHLGFVAINRQTESLSLFQQMVGRGLRTNEGKTNCIVLVPEKRTMADLKADLSNITYANKSFTILGQSVSLPKLLNKTVKPILNKVVMKLI